MALPRSLPRPRTPDPMDAPPLRWGVLGTGWIAERFAAALHAGTRQQVYAVGSRSPGSADRFAAAVGAPTAYGSYEALVADPAVDVVYVATPHNAHHGHARMALEAGKHVLVEKPMAVTLEEAAQLVELARRGPGYLLPAPHVILSPTLQTIGRRIHRGHIGQVLSARALYGHSGPTWGPWFYRRGGGSLFDLAVYNVTSLTGLLGPVQRVTSMTGIAIPERIVDGEKVRVEAEDNAHVLLDFGDSRFAVVTTGFTIQQYRCPAIELYGSTGTIQMLGDDWDPNGYELWQNEVGAWQIHSETAPDWPWTDGLRHLVESIGDNVPPIITPEHGYHVLEIMLKAQESGRDGQARAIESTFTPPSFEERPDRGSAPIAHDRTRTEE